jgi:GAF domain-containing protein
VPAERRSRILAELAADGGKGWPSTRLCVIARDVLGVSGAGVMLMSGDVPSSSLCSTDAVSGLIEQLQFALGEGPCVDAVRHSRVVLEPDLARSGSTWPAFTTPALEAGVRALFAFPLHVGAERLGALDLYRDGPGPLSADQHADALVLADVAASWVLDVQAKAPEGSLAAELERDTDFHVVVHNAAGAVSVQLGVSVADALVRLRAHAFSTGRPLVEIAEDVVTRRVRF